MEEKLIDRIGDEYLNPNFQDGQILLNSDVNEIVSIVKEGINANFNDIQKIQNGSHQVGNAKQLDGADLSKFSDGEMVGSDKLIPTSQQVKSYVDSKVQEIKDTTEVGKLVEDLNALGIEVGNKVDKTDLVNEETTGEDKAYNCDYINELFENGVGDSLPIGTIVEYTGENIPDGFEEVIEPEDATVYVGPTEPTGGQDVWIQKGKNLFNSDSHIVSNGTFYDWNNGSSATNNEYYGVKIPVLPNTVYVSSSDLEPGYWSSLCYWDKDMNFISGAAYNANYKVITTPSNCAYITFALMKTYNWFQLEQGSTVTEYEPYISKKIFVKNDNGGYEEVYNEEEHNKEIYSTEEQRIGTWIDGKTLYRKVYDCGLLLNGGTKEVPTGLTNVNYLKWDTIAVYMKGGSTDWPYQITQNTTISDKKVKINCQGDLSSYNGYVTILYTKNN